jgi:PAS domain S-box-containing protein
VTLTLTQREKISLRRGRLSGAIIEQDMSEGERFHKELSLARELALAIGEADTVEHAMKLTLRKICEATGWELGEAWVRKGDQLELRSFWHMSKDHQLFDEGLTGFRARRGMGLPGHAWLTKNPVWMRNLASDPRFLRGSLARTLGLVAAMAVPVLSSDEVVAVLVFFVSQPRDEDEHMIDVVSAVSAQLGSLIRRKQVEEALRSSEEQLRAVADTAIDAIVSADSRGKITYFNKAAEEIFGYSANEVIGESLTVLMPERFHAAHRRGFERYLSTGEAHVIGTRVELEGRRKDGAEFPLELALSCWNAGGETFFTGMLRDIEERRRAEEALRQSDALKTALLRTVSHDLRSPLTAIVAAGESSASPNIDLDGRRELASVIVGEGVRLSRLVDKLLDLSRLQGGAAAPRQVSCSIEEIIETALDQMPATGPEFELEFDSTLPSVLADATQLERAFVNLFENALRYAGSEPVQVTAKASDQQLIVRVTDRGPGIPDADREQIFEPFYRAREGEGNHHGSGLGLAIVKGFVEANGGHVWTESRAGSGATFVVELPVQQPDHDAGRPEKR